MQMSECGLNCTPPTETNDITRGVHWIRCHRSLVLINEFSTWIQRRHLLNVLFIRVAYFVNFYMLCRLLRLYLAAEEIKPIAARGR